MNKLLKQHDVKWLRWLGTFIIALYLTSPILGLMISIMESGTFYGVQSNNIHRFAPWMSFPIFILVAILAGLTVVCIFYIVIYPVYQAALNRQTYIHKNPMQEDLAKILKNQDKIMEKLGLKDDDVNNTNFSQD